MDPQQSIQLDLLIDGYIAQMFGPLDADAYLTSLLNRERIQWHIDSTGAFLAPPPPGLASDQHDCIIDYGIGPTSTCPVIQQKIWAPKKSSDRVRRVDHEQLHLPIFFIHKNGRDLGLPLIEAAGGDCTCLRGAEETVPIATSHAQIRINWHGYLHLNWNEQISIRKATGAALSLEAFVKHIGRKVLKFMETAKTWNQVYDGDRRYLIGDDYITPRDIILIGTVHVSQGSWMPIKMPILQLSNGYSFNYM